MNTRINGVWWGPELTPIQQLSIQSYLYHGHDFHLYTSDINLKVPYGCQKHHVAEIISDNRDRFVCESHFSDYFRVKLIQKIGGWYVDLDTICLKHFDFSADMVFVSENSFGSMRDPDSTSICPSRVVTKLINGCIFKCPVQSDFLANLVDRIENMDTRNLKLPQDWLAVGPALFRLEVPSFNYNEFVQPPITFDGVSPDELHMFVTKSWKLSPESYTIHLRSSGWKRGGLFDPYKTYPENSMFEQLKRKHNIWTK